MSQERTDERMCFGMVRGSRCAGIRDLKLFSDGAARKQVAPSIVDGAGVHADEHTVTHLNRGGGSRLVAGLRNIITEP